MALSGTGKILYHFNTRPFIIVMLVLAAFFIAAFALIFSGTEALISHCICYYTK